MEESGVSAPTEASLEKEWAQWALRPSLMPGCDHRARPRVREAQEPWSARFQNPGQLVVAPADEPEGHLTRRPCASSLPAPLLVHEGSSAT